MEDHILFQKICQKNRFDISENALGLLQRYIELLIEWNQKINLISRKDIGNIWSRHILGSVSFLFGNRFINNASVVDIGTGGGLPGIPIALLQPDIDMLLIDSIQKKILAVENILGVLNLQKVKAALGRAEDLSNTKQYFRKFDYVIARAVAPIHDLIKWGTPFLKKIDPASAAASGKNTIPPGSIVLLKGGDLQTEIQTARIKCKPRSITERPIVFEGGEAVDELFDKKVVIIQP